MKIFYSSFIKFGLIHVITDKHLLFLLPDNHWRIANRAIRIISITVYFCG